MSHAPRHTVPARTIEASILFFILVVLALSPPADAQVTLSLSGEQDGASASVLWINGPRLAYGLSHNRFRGAEWTYGTATYTWRKARWITQAEANLGAGRAEESFPYRVFRLSATREVVPARLYVDVEQRFLNIDRLRGNLLRGGLTWLASPEWMFSSSVYGSLGGNLEMRYLTARIDQNPSPIGLLAGASVGRSESGYFREPGLALPGSSSEFFGGVSFLTRSGKGTFIVSSTTTESDDRLRASVSWTFAD